MSAESTTPTKTPPEHGSSTTDEVMTTEQVAKLLQVVPGTLRRWRFNGEGPPWVKLAPKLCRYRRTEVMAWLAEHETQGGGQRVQQLGSGSA